MWLPTPDAMVTRMLEAAKATCRRPGLRPRRGRRPHSDRGGEAIRRTRGGHRIRPGAGRARQAQCRARRRGRQSHDHRRATSSRRISRRASVVTLYLLPDLNYQLRPTLLDMKPGTRVVSHMWDMGEWEPDEAFVVEGSEAFLWIVPARVAGRWTLRDDRGFEGEVDIDAAVPAHRRHADLARQDAAAARRLRERRHRRLHVPGCRWRDPQHSRAGRRAIASRASCASSAT